MPSAPDVNAADFYKVLGVDKGADEKEIAKAYKRAALKYHPDKNPDNPEKAEENFKKITEAYECLHDADKRRTYDQFGKAGLSGGGGGGPGSGGVSMQQADQIFKAFFGGGDPFSMMGGGFDEDNEMGGFFPGGMPGGGGRRVVFTSGGGGGMPGMGGMGGMGGMPFDFGGMPGGFGGNGGKGGGKSSRPAPIPPHAMSAGTTVVVRDLAKAQEHNGKVGKITSWNASTSRYEVEVNDGETTLSLRPSNLTQTCAVEVANVESQESLNGQVGEILSYSDSNGRYVVRLKQKLANGRDVIGLEPSKLILRTGTRIVVQGLSNDAYNGQMGQIKDVDKEAQRYTVELQGGKSIKIKYDNVLC